MSGKSQKPTYCVVVSQIRLPITAPKEEAVEIALRRLRVPSTALHSVHIHKVSLDARKSRQQQISFVYSVWVEVDQGWEPPRKVLQQRDISIRRIGPFVPVMGTERHQGRICVAGFGPAGMFAALLLAEYGYEPLVLERGASVEERVSAVQRFWEYGLLDERSNVQFGEGGAGTFSDGKLTTRIKDPLCDYVLQKLCEHGAPREILYRAKPHIGTDLLRGVVQSIRRKIVALGGEVRFLTQLEEIRLRQGAVSGVKAGKAEIPVDALILAIGHSARDTFTYLAEQGLPMQPKAFSVGVRIEHLQSDINQGLYGDLAGYPMLPPGEYQLSHRDASTGTQRGVYTFCMCPGGFVVPSASQPDMVVTNGMSEFARDGVNANAAVVVSVQPGDFGRNPLDGVLFQQELERRAFVQGGGTYRAPCVRVDDFVSGKNVLRVGKVVPTYSCGVVQGDFDNLFPSFVTKMLRTGLLRFDRQLPGFAAGDALLTGVETRTSSPLRIMRGDTLESPAVRGLYPCGEGAGYAGGIVSAAVDGLHCAAAVMARFAPLG